MTIFDYPKEVNEVIEQFFKTSEQILDIGCGVARSRLCLANKRVLGIDVIDDYVRQARSRTENGIYIRMDARDLRVFGDKTFDGALAVDVIEHLSELAAENVLEEIKRISHRAFLFLPEGTTCDPIIDFWGSGSPEIVEALRHKSVWTAEKISNAGYRTETWHGYHLRNNALLAYWDDTIGA